MRVGEYLSVPRPVWDWRSQDCCRWVARWVEHRGHANPIDALGLAYDSQTSALRCIVKNGGLTCLWSAGMALVGLPEVDDPRAGDVAVIARPTVCGLGEAMAIRVGERWASLSLRGLDIGPADALRVWRP